MIHPSFHSKIQYFLTVAETLNFRRAAELLGIAQPALSRSIRQLEQQFGFSLFERSTRRVALTPAGEVLYRDGADAMRRLTNACARAGQIANGLSGSIMVGYSTFAATGPMSDIIIEFRKLYPEAHVALRLLASSEQATAFERGTIDLGFIMSNVLTLPQKSILISRERLIVLVSAKHPWANDESITLETLVTGPIVIGTANRWQGFRSLVNDMVTSRGLKLNVAEEADDLPVLLQLVRSDFGCTILDASFISTLPPGIKKLEIADTHETLDIALAWREDNLSPLAARFVDAARAHTPS
ncbi:DNA-binding transcriptional regulator, LysR family [Bradyrhizobium lablabi]|uniref:DNA-binding transcriptional regulator, LysR family n=3 Tax=Nitrobacteraceae TaxID=41294 RepID=A0ABY0Q8M6_9BRAD|nr:DNA-binding transcriptional regulator, LysR family [Bradyrhizobium ottawaense]SEC23559.1 DNA-binding transcriptional regulator, LysR family [Bradyrhizobium lablabi]